MKIENCTPYRPSSGTDGDYFIEGNCHSCIHGKYEHTGDTDDLPCDIVTRAFLFAPPDKEYPKEWIYEKGEPKCTSRVPWDWDQDDDGNWNCPPKPEPINPNQLVMPFIFEEIENNTIKVKEHETNK